MNEPTILTPENAVFSVGNDRMLHLSINEQDQQSVGIRQMFPVSNPDKFLSVHNEKEEIGVIEDLSNFSDDQQRLIRTETEHQYFVPIITEIIEIKDDFSYFRWNTLTDRGPREFYVKGHTENMRRRKGQAGSMQIQDNCRIFITDIEDCKYEIPDYRKLPKSSLRFLEKIM